MGKIRRAIQKYHTASQKSSENNESNQKISTDNPLPLLPTTDNIFAGINISFDNIKNNLSDNASVKSYKSTKSEISRKISKKDKQKLRHDILLQKIDTVTQFKKEQNKRKKRKNNVIIGDTNALRDALPSLDSLLKSRDFKISIPQPPKKKGIVKQSKRKKNIVEGVNIYKTLLTNKQYKKEPLKIISEIVKQRVKSGSI